MYQHQKRNFIAILPNGTEVPFDCTFDSITFDSLLKQAVLDVVHEAGIRGRRNQTTLVTVQVHELTIVKGEISRGPAQMVRVTPYQEPLTALEYDKEADALLNTLPPEFRNVISVYAYERGHSAGYEECLQYVQGMVGMLAEPIQHFHDRIVTETEIVNQD